MPIFIVVVEVVACIPVWVPLIVAVKVAETVVERLMVTVFPKTLIVGVPVVPEGTVKAVTELLFVTVAVAVKAWLIVMELVFNVELDAA